MVNIADVYPSNSFKGADLKGKQPTRVTIESAEAENFDDGMKLVLRFKNDRRVLICNKTKSTLIADFYGPETDAWIGRDILLSHTRVSFNGKMWDAIAVDVPGDEMPVSQTQFNPKPAIPEGKERARRRTNTPVPPLNDPLDDLASEMSDKVPY